MKKKYGKRVKFRMAGMFEEAYKQRIDELVNDGIIEYLGYQADMKSLYGAASCVVLPSYHEGMSNVLLEAAATGRPLITSDIPGLPRGGRGRRQRVYLPCEGRRCAI